MSKYNSKKIRVGDDVFDSKREYNYWMYLKNRQKKGEIRDLKRQVKFI